MKTNKIRVMAVLMTACVMLIASSCSTVNTGESVPQGSSSEETKEVTTVSETEETSESVTESASEETTETSKAPLVPEGMTGPWKCEPIASDGKTDTSFYAMYIKKNGYFSMYDFAAGNPGISGFLKNDTGSTLDVVFGTGDFDPPFCWKLDPSEDTFMYELDKDTLKLGHDGVWMIFHPDPNDEYWEDTEYPNMPMNLDDILTLKIPSDYELDMTYTYNDEAWTSVVQKAFYSEDKGYFSVGIASYKGYDCLGDIEAKVDPDENTGLLKDKRSITVDGKEGCFGTCESDDTEGMVAVVYVTSGDYLIEFRLTNGDEKVTEDQIKEFEKIIGTVKFL